jgi:hypothetical protein
VVRVSHRVGLWAASVAAAFAWSPQPTPTPRLTSGAVLSSVACPSSRMCVAVGYAVNAAGAPEPLIERWNGLRWTIEPSVSPRPATSSFLFGVSCATTRSCTAVGSLTRRPRGTVPFVEHLAGGRWISQRTPRPPQHAAGDVGYLAAVSCPRSIACTAVGYTGRPQGTKGRPLIERWTAARGWASERAPVPSRTAASFLSGVSCPSTRRCTAVGFSNRRAGAPRALAETWSVAGGWTTQAIPTPTGATVVQLTGVACPSVSRCMAVGSFEVAGVMVLLTEDWDGQRWVIGHPRYPAGARGVSLADVTCPSPRACIAVGTFTDTAGLGEPLAERWTPRGWAIQPTPAPDTAAGPVDGGLAGVSCPSLTRCMAVGSVTPLSGEGEHPLSLSWST